MEELDGEEYTLTLLGLDIGTTHVKARAYDEEGRLLASARRKTPTNWLPGGGAEYHAGPLEQAIFDTAAETIAAAGPPRAIGVSSVGEAGFLVDENGAALAPAIAWFDGRASPQAARWKERLAPRELFIRTGLHPNPLFSACKMEWTQENDPEVWARANGWLGIAEYAVFRMTGERGTDPSLAGRTMLYRLASGEWDEELCELAGIPVDFLPPVYPSGSGPGELSKEAAEKFGAREGVPVVVCGHDHICGSFGAGAAGPGEIVDSMGTAEASLLTLRFPPLDDAGYELGLPAGSHVMPQTYYLAATLPRSGGLVEQLVALLGGGGDDLARWTEEAAALAPGKGGACLPPTDDDPGENGLLMAALGQESSPGHLLRAVLEGLTLQMNSDLRRATRVSEVEPSRITLVGGGARNPLWAKLKADVSNLPVRVVADPECVARGAALLAGVGAGIFPDTESVPTPEYGAYIEPSGEHAEYERLYAEVYEPLRERAGRNIP
ncbi:MAG: FGGY family carbohydrate kinase [Actinomycetota bacterium]|nr:FGGY family carbohydrate kinase [Actinomycetota bacterium]